MNETERLILTQTAELTASTAIVAARILRGLDAMRLSLQDTLPGFEKAYLSRFAEGDQDIANLSADLTATAQALSQLLHPAQDTKKAL